jgi:hypothetical protein
MDRTTPPQPHYTKGAETMATRLSLLLAALLASTAICWPFGAVPRTDAAQARQPLSSVCRTPRFINQQWQPVPSSLQWPACVKHPPSPALKSPRVRTVPARQSPLIASTQSYIAALKHSLAAGSFSDLRAAFAAHATLTERSSITGIESTPQISTFRRQRAVIRFYRHLTADIAGSRWIVSLMNQVSPATMVVYAYTSGGRRTPPLYSVHRLVVRNRAIVSVDLTLIYQA